jgi:hypothetical protein
VGYRRQRRSRRNRVYPAGKKLQTVAQGASPPPGSALLVGADDDSAWGATAQAVAGWHQLNFFLVQVVGDSAPPSSGLYLRTRQMVSNISQKLTSPRSKEES